jgi:hypothetical protein
MANERYGHTATLLPSGEMLIAGDENTTHARERARHRENIKRLKQ